MIAAIFEVRLRPGARPRYLDLAAVLRAELDRVDGFISVERFASLADETKILSLSFWRDEQALRAWREFAPHRAAQGEGRENLFADYRIRVASVVRDYGTEDRRQAP